MAKSNKFYKSRTGQAIIGVVSLGLAWLVWLRASDTGSLQQYGILIVLTIFGISRLIWAIRRKDHQ